MISLRVPCSGAYFIPPVTVVFFFLSIFPTWGQQSPIAFEASGCLSWLARRQEFANSLHFDIISQCSHGALDGTKARQQPYDDIEGNGPLIHYVL